MLVFIWRADCYAGTVFLTLRCWRWQF